jgi:hypothetical protein
LHKSQNRLCAYAPDWPAPSEPEGIYRSDHEQGEIGPDLFRKACEFGFEGLVSKRSDRPYRGGRCSHWVKIKNRTHPAMAPKFD